MNTTEQLELSEGNFHWLAAAKMVHRSWGCQPQHTTIECLYVTELSEDKLAVDSNVVSEINELGTERCVQLCIFPLKLELHTCKRPLAHHSTIFSREFFQSCQKYKSSLL